MDSGIGSPCSHQTNALPYQFAQCFFQSLLNTHGIGLSLPTVISRSVVRQLNKISLQFHLQHKDIVLGNKSAVLKRQEN
jgi:hypothetical protein